MWIDGHSALHIIDRETRYSAPNFWAHKVHNCSVMDIIFTGYPETTSLEEGKHFTAAICFRPHCQEFRKSTLILGGIEPEKPRFFSEIPRVSSNRLDVALSSCNVFQIDRYTSQCFLRNKDQLHMQSNLNWPSSCHRILVADIPSWVCRGSCNETLCPRCIFSKFHNTYFQDSLITRVDDTLGEETEHVGAFEEENSRTVGWKPRTTTLPFLFNGFWIDNQDFDGYILALKNYSVIPLDLPSTYIAGYVNSAIGNNADNSSCSARTLIELAGSKIQSVCNLNTTERHPWSHRIVCGVRTFIQRESQIRKHRGSFSGWSVCQAILCPQRTTETKRIGRILTTPEWTVPVSLRSWLPTSHFCWCCAGRQLTILRENSPCAGLLLLFFTKK